MGIVVAQTLLSGETYYLADVQLCNIPLICEEQDKEERSWNKEIWQTDSINPTRRRSNEPSCRGSLL